MNTKKLQEGTSRVRALCMLGHKTTQLSRCAALLARRRSRSCSTLRATNITGTYRLWVFSKHQH